MSKYRPYLGIYIIAVWSLILAGQNLVRLLYTSQAGLSNLSATASAQAQTYFTVYQWVTFAFAVTFIIAAFGLWNRKNWGRLLFLVTAVLFFSLSMVGLFMGQINAPNLPEKVLLAFQYILSVGLPLAYLNLPFVKLRFQQTQSEEVLSNDI